MLPCADDISHAGTIMAYVGCLLQIFFISMEIQQREMEHFTERLSCRIGLCVAFGIAGLAALRRRGSSPTAWLWMVTLVEIIVAVMLQLRNLYEPELSAFWRVAGMWSVGVKAGLACFEVGYARFLVFLAAEAVATSAGQFIRPAWDEFPWRWILWPFIWFAANSYYVERKARQAFVQKCEFRVAYALAEEAHRLHRLLTDHTVEMICVHDIPQATDASLKPFARTKYVSKSCEQLTGWNTLDLLNKTPLEFVHSDDIEVARDFYRSELAQSGDADDLITTSFLQAAGMTSSIAASNDGAAATESGDSDAVLSLGFDDLAKLERNPSTVEMMPLIAKQSIEHNTSKMEDRGLARGSHSARDGVQRSKVHPSPIAASPSRSPARLIRARRITPPTNIPATPTLARWRPSSNEGTSSSTSAPALPHIQPSMAVEGNPPKQHTRHEDVIQRPSEEVGVEDIHPLVIGTHVRVPTLSSALPTARSRGVHLRFIRKTGEYMLLEVTKSLTPEGIVCVYRDAAWRYSPRHNI
jgi:hypothetical protein